MRRCVAAPALQSLFSECPLPPAALGASAVVIVGRFRRRLFRSGLYAILGLLGLARCTLALGLFFLFRRLFSGYRFGLGFGILLARSALPLWLFLGFRCFLFRRSFCFGVRLFLARCAFLLRLLVGGGSFLLYRCFVSRRFL